MAEPTKSTPEVETPTTPEKIKEGNPKETPKNPKEEDKGGEKVTLTQDALNKTIAERLERQKKTLTEEFTSKMTESIAKAIDEERKTAKLSADEREAKLKKEQEEKLNQREQKITLDENRLKGLTKLGEVLPELKTEQSNKIIEFLVNSDLAAQESNIVAFADTVKEMVESLVATRMTDTPPKDIPSEPNSAKDAIAPATFL